MRSSAVLKEGRLVIENGRLRWTADWNNGHLRTRVLEDVRREIQWDFQAKMTDLAFPGAPEEADEGRLEVREIPDGPVTPAHLQAHVTFRLDGLFIKRVFRIYPDCPVLAWDLHLRGRTPGSWEAGEILKNSRPIEDIRAALDKKIPVPLAMRLSFGEEGHSKLACVEFSDRTDHHNNLLQTRRLLPFSMPSALKGNILLLSDTPERRGLVLLKEGALGAMQTRYPGFDFIVSRDRIMMAGLGAAPEDIREAEWTRVYGTAMGVGRDREGDLLNVLRDYQERQRVYVPERDSMILMNTWGDRGQDRSMGETFALREIEAAKRLSITRFQLDDGWQAGRTINSAQPGGTLSGLWESGDFWKPHPQRFPNGLRPVVDEARKAGVELCLWFNPCADDSYAAWEKDADCLIELFRVYGIRTFKIDGVEIPGRPAETRLRAMFDKVLSATQGEAVFNLDVTAGRRFGYFWFNEYGNRFLENRYTDWRNYYPHWTLRNLWTLSRFMPPQSLQIEFLNKWRNAEKYGAEDALAPSRVPFDYCFAVTMAAQPLAWFEGSQLPEEAFAIAPLIAGYRKIQAELHACRIFPMGEEPDGFSWSGFQAVGKEGGFVLVYREKSAETGASLALWESEKGTYGFEPVLGRGRSFSAQPDKSGRIPFSLPAPFSFCLYRYKRK